jgi:hypothetical protein
MYGVISRGVILIMGITSIMKGIVRGQAMAITTSLGEEDGLCRTTSVGTVEFRPGSHRPRHAREKEREKGSLLLARAGLSSYLYRPYTTCINLSMLGVVFTSPQYDVGRPRAGEGCSSRPASRQKGWWQLFSNTARYQQRRYHARAKQAADKAKLVLNLIPITTRIPWQELRTRRPSSSKSFFLAIGSLQQSTRLMLGVQRSTSRFILNSSIYCLISLLHSRQQLKQASSLYQRVLSGYRQTMGLILLRTGRVSVATHRLVAGSAV